MPRPVVLPEPMESLARFVEDTDPRLIVGATLARLRKGADPRDLLAAAAIAVSRSTELPADHHGGPVHPVSGISALTAASALVGGDWAQLPVLHGVALANKHIHAPEMGPAIMVEREAAGGDKADNARAMLHEIEQFHPATAERHLLGLLKQGASAGEVLDPMMSVANIRNAYDDHYLLYPLYAAMALDAVGWEWAPWVLRPVVRYLATNMRMGSDKTGFTVAYLDGNFAFFRHFEKEAPRLIEAYELDSERVRTRAERDEGAAIVALAEEIGEGDDYASIAERMARALAGGLSLEGAGEALSIVAGLRYLRTAAFNPFDVHMHTGIYARRYLIGLDGVSRRNKVLALLNWAVGPEVRFQDAYLAWSNERGPDPLPGAGEAALLDEMTRVVKSWDRSDLADPDDAVECKESPTVQQVVALARQYVESGFAPEPFFRRMAEIVCQDDFTEMHAFKHILATTAEYRATPASHRWVHMVSAAKGVATSWGLVQDVYRAAREEKLAV